MEHDFWLKFSGEKNLGRNYDKINPTAFVPNSNYICFFKNPIYLLQKHVKQNGVKYNECGNITQMLLNNVQWRNNIKKNFIIENDICNLKFIMFHADDINSVKMYNCILLKVEWDSVDKLVCDTRINFCASYLLHIQPKFWKFCESAYTTCLYKS